MKSKEILTLLIATMILCCTDDHTSNPEILSPDSTTVWQHWMYAGQVIFAGIDAEISHLLIVNPEGSTFSINSTKLGSNLFQLAEPLNPAWGSGLGFMIMAISNNDTILSEPFTIEPIELPDFDVAKVLTTGTKFYYIDNNDYYLSRWQEEVIGDTILGGNEYAIVSGSGWWHKSYQRADSRKLYYYHEDGEHVYFDLDQTGDGITHSDSMSVFGFELEGVAHRHYVMDESMWYSGTGNDYVKLFGHIYNDVSNPQWMENSWRLTGVQIDGVVYGDTTHAEDH